MNFEWESEEKKLSRYMKISPKKKLEWLRKMHEFTIKTSSTSMLSIRWRLRRSQ